MISPESLLNLIKNSNLYIHVGYDNHQWMIKLMDDISKQNLYEEFDSISQNMGSEFFSSWDFNIGDDFNKQNYKFSERDAGLFYAGCIHMFEQVFSTQFKPNPTQVALLCLKIGINTYNRAKILKTVSSYYGIDMKTLHSTLSRLTGEGIKSQPLYRDQYGDNTRDDLELIDKHKIYAEWLKTEAKKFA